MIDPLSYNNEVFKPIQLEGLKDRYNISNYGKVINRITGKTISPQLTNDGYLRVRLTLKDGSYRSYLVHRLVMMAFHPISNPDDLEVNHIYGVKIDNYDNHLEWVTGKENMVHAFKTGLNKNIRETHSRAAISNDQATMICEELSKGVDFELIAQKLDGVQSKNIMDLIRSIYRRKTWTSISKDYVFYDYGNRRNLFSDDEVHLICKMLSDGSNYIEILRVIGYDVDNMNKNELYNLSDVISNIRVGRYYANISSMYTFPTNKKRYDQLFDINEIEEICRLLQDGMSYRDIATKMGYTRLNTDSKKYSAILHFLYRIKGRKQHTEISYKYSF